MPSRPFPKVSPERLLEILRLHCESGDILCGDAADEIERLRQTPSERTSLEYAVRMIDDINRGDPEHAATLRAFLERTK